MLRNGILGKYNDSMLQTVLHNSAQSSRYTSVLCAPVSVRNTHERSQRGERANWLERSVSPHETQIECTDLQMGQAVNTDGDEIASVAHRLICKVCSSTGATNSTSCCVFTLYYAASRVLDSPLLAIRRDTSASTSAETTASRKHVICAEAIYKMANQPVRTPHRHTSHTMSYPQCLCHSSQTMILLPGIAVWQP